MLLLVRKGRDGYFERDKVRSVLEGSAAKVSSQLGLAIVEVQVSISMDSGLLWANFWGAFRATFGALFGLLFVLLN